MLDPTIKMPEGSRPMTVPAIVTAEPPAEMVVPAIGKAVGFGVNFWPATVNGDSVGKVGDGV